MSEEEKSVATELEVTAEATEATEAAEAAETAETPEAETADSAKAEKAVSKPSKKRKIAIIVVIVVAVLGVAGAAFWVWHETPGFCDAICHNPQDPYNPTYYADPGKATTDKWGNEVEDASSMLAPVHRVDADANCLSCHNPTLREQVVEGFAWVTGGFYNPLSERSLENLTSWRSNEETTSFCLRAGCHDIAKSDLTTQTSDMARNPHAWHHSEYTCSDCHKSHRASVFVCTQCHDDAVAPEGWLTWDESQNLETRYLSYDQEKIVSGK